MKCNHSNAAFAFLFKGNQEKSEKQKGIFNMQPAFSGFAVLGAVFIEIAGFIIIGSGIGVLPTLTLVMLSMFAGVYLLRSHGISILQRIRDELSAGRIPDREMAEGAMIMAGAILLIIPGFVSDIIGLLLFIQPVQKLIRHYLSKRIIRDRRYTGNRRQETKTIDPDNHDYHSSDPESSPWRDPWNNKKQ